MQSSHSSLCELGYRGAMKPIVYLDMCPTGAIPLGEG
jgi:hypothetical protein